MQPERKDGLVRSTELLCPCHDSAAIAPNWKLKGVTVFQSQLFGGRLGAAIKRDGARSTACFRDAVCTKAFGPAQ